MRNRLKKLVKDAFAKASGKSKRDEAATLAASGPSGRITSSNNAELAEATHDTPASGEKKGKQKDTEVEGDDGGEESDNVDSSRSPKAKVEQRLALPSAATTLTVEEKAPAEGADTVPVPLTWTNKSGPVDSSTSNSKAPAVATSASTEEFGLFPFPPRQTADGTLSYEPEPQTSANSSFQHADIVVVHGVGGHWKNTWEASNDAIWPRDRIPELFAGTNIRCRVRSFGYNSASFFTRGGIDIRDCAKDLIDRIRVLRRKDTDEFRPIIFIAHSLGGILVKEALNRAWTRQSLYEDVLSAVKGCIFLGVPHRGAAIASWAEHASQITKFLTIGFAGNTSFLETLKPDSKEWIRISDDFVDRGKDLNFCTFYETKKTGNLMVVDKRSAIMHLPNEECFAVQGSNHRTIARFVDDENERFSLVGDAVYNLVRGALKGKQQTTSSQTLIFDLPPATSHFFGREMELDRLRDVLDPSKPSKSMKGIVLYGLAGSGKTQLALNFIEDCKRRYSAILWINASSKEAIAQSFRDIETTMTETWPSRDLPNPVPRGVAAEKVVLSRLRSAIYNRWLLVIDSADDAETTNFASFIPSGCHHGSVIVTSTRRSAVDQFEPAGFCSQEVDSLDDQSAGQLLHYTACPRGSHSHSSSTENTEAIKIVKELHGIPLAVEQAGVLIRKNIVTFGNFIDKYSTHYKILMSKRPTPGVTFYEKEHSVVAIISLLFSVVQDESPDSARLLRLLCVLGHQSIPLDLLRSFAKVPSGVGSTAAPSSLAKLVSDETILLICMSTLSDVCLVKFRDNQARTDKIISVHGLICRWVVDVIINDHPDDLLWVLEGVMGYIQPSIDSPIFPYRPDHEPVTRAYTSLLDHTIKVTQDKLKVDLSLPSKDDQVARLRRKLAYVYLGTGQLQEATKILEGCIELERELQADVWPSTESSLELLVGLAVCRQKLKDHQAAIDALQTSLKLAESLFDNFDDRTAEISERLKVILERQEAELQQHKAVVLASTGAGSTKERLHRITAQLPSRDEEGGQSVADMDGQLWFDNFSRWLKSGDWHESRTLLDTFDFNARIGGKTILMHALVEKSDVAAGILHDEKSHEMDLEAVDLENQSALFYASLAGHGLMIRRLVEEFGMDPNLRNIRGQTALLRVLQTLPQKFEIPEALISCGANPDIPDHKGVTPFMKVTRTLEGSIELMRLFYNTGNVNIDRKDHEGNTVLHRSIREHGLSKRAAVIRQVIEWGADVNLKNKDGDTPLHLLLSRVRLREEFKKETRDILLELLTPQTDINCRNDIGQTAVHLGSLACLASSTFNMILDFPGADIDAKDNQGLTPLMAAAQCGAHVAIAELVCREGLDVNALDKKGKSALFHAIDNFRGGSFPMLSLLTILENAPGIKLGPYGYGLAKEYNSVLYAALYGGDLAFKLKMFVERSLVETLVAIKLAEEKGLADTRELIKSRGVEVYGKRQMNQEPSFDR